MSLFSSDEMDIIFRILGGNHRGSPFTTAIRAIIPGNLFAYCNEAELWADKYMLPPHRFFFHHVSHDKFTREEVINLMVKSLRNEEKEEIGNMIKELCSSKKIDVETARSVIQPHLENDKNDYFKQILDQLEGCENKLFKQYNQHFTLEKIRDLISTYPKLLSCHSLSVWADDLWLRRAESDEIRIYKKMETVYDATSSKVIKIRDLITDVVTVVKTSRDMTQGKYLKELHTRYLDMPVTIQKAPIWSGKNVKGTVEDQHEFYPNGDLQSLLAAQHGSPLSFNEIIPIINDCLDALTFIHRKGIFHLDIKPANIMRDIANRAVLIDWNPVQSNIMSPLYTNYRDIEKLQDAKDDNSKINEIQNKRNVYAMGLIFFQLATGIDINNLENFMLNYCDIKDFFGKTVSCEESSLQSIRPSLYARNIQEFHSAMKKSLVDARCQKDLMDLILWMTNPDTQKRIYSWQAKVFFNMFFTYAHNSIEVFEFLKKLNNSVKDGSNKL